MGSLSVAESLLRDRFSEFQRLAQKSQGAAAGAGGAAASLLQAGAGWNSEAVAPAAEASSFMREFFTEVKDIQGELEKGRSNVKVMGQVLEEALQATTQDREQAVSERLQDLVEETNGYVGTVKLRLEALKARSQEDAAKQPNSAQSKIRNNMQLAMAKEHQQALVDFQKAQVDFKRALERRQAREMQILMPDVSEAEREAMIESGETAALVVAKKMAGTHAVLLDEVRRIQEKHQDIIKLERSIQDLAQMFQEMSVLVDSQGEMLDAIEVHVQNAKCACSKAEENLIGARKAQHSGRKWMCCMTIFVMIVLLVILGPILIR